MILLLLIISALKCTKSNKIALLYSVIGFYTVIFFSFSYFLMAINNDTLLIKNICGDRTQLTISPIFNKNKSTVHAIIRTGAKQLLDFSHKCIKI